MAITYPRDLPDVPFETSRFGLNVNQSSFGSAISRKIQIQQHAAGVTDRWEGLFTTPRLSNVQHAELTMLLISLRGREGTFLAGNPDNKTSRAATPWNLLPATSFDTVNSIAAAFNVLWSEKPLYLLNLKPGDIISTSARVKSDTGADRINVVLRTVDINGTTITSYQGNQVTSAVLTASTISNITLDPATHSLTWFIQNSDTTENATAQDAYANRGAAAERKALVNGTSQTGRALNVDGLPTSTSGLALIGDYFTLEAMLYRLTEPIDSDGSGQATLAFEPALKTSPADNAQLLFENTTTTCRLLGNVASWETDHIKTGPISFAWEEVI